MLKVHFIDCGQGDTSLLELPNGEKMLIDVNLTDEVKDYLQDVIHEDSDGSRIIDYLVITHPHNDHIRGIKSLTENFTIKEIWESGHRFTVPKDQQEEYQDYIDMRNIINSMKKVNPSSVKVPTAQRAVYKSIGGVDFYIFSPSRSFVETDNPSEIDIHEQCMVMKVVYAGNSILFAGDSNRKSWQDRIVKYYSDNGGQGQENLLKSNILHASHHGSYTFFMDEDIDDEEKHFLDGLVKIDPDLTIISVGENNFNHPHPTAEAYYRKYSYKKSTDQVFITKELGTIVADFFGNGTYRIMPSEHFYLLFNGGKYSSGFATVNISVVNYSKEPNSDGTFPKNTNLTFKANIKKVNGVEIKRIIWQVQNNGVGNDSRIHDCYFGKNEKSTNFVRDAVYHGTHNLLCKVYANRRGLVASHLIQVKVAPQ